MPGKHFYNVNSAKCIIALIRWLRKKDEHPKSAQKKVKSKV